MMSLLSRSNAELRVRRRGVALILLGVLVASTPAAAQWLRYPIPGVPRMADGTVDSSAKTPRLANGKPDLSGIWTSDEPDARNPDVPPTPYDATRSRRMINLGIELPDGLPYQPWLAALVKERTANRMVDDPHIRCMPDNFLRSWAMPHLIKLVHSPSLLVVLNEWNTNYRQILADGRPLPEDPTPSWEGYSVGKWEGDTFVVDTIGFRDDLWIDWNGSVITHAAKVREEYTRPDFGHMLIKVTVDDPKAYTAPWTVTIRERIIGDAELIDEVCLENERSLVHMK